MTVRGAVIGLVAMAMAACTGESSQQQGTISQAGTSSGKVVICHVPPGDPTSRQTIVVAESAEPAHLAHGDSLGACPNGCSSAADCDDGNLCTSDACGLDGTCQHVSVNCDDSNACTTDSCAPATGCAYTTAANGTSCDDGNACTQTDSCQAGACVGGDPVVCTPEGDCLTAGTCDPQTGACSHPPMYDGYPCHLTAYTIGLCEGGVCSPTDERCGCFSVDSAGSCILTTTVCEPAECSGAADGTYCSSGGVSVGLCEGGTCAEADTGCICTPDLFGNCITGTIICVPLPS